MNCQNPTICCLREILIKVNIYVDLKKDTEKELPSCSSDTDRKKAGGTVLISDNIDFRTRNRIKDEEQHKDKGADPPRSHSSTKHMHPTICEKYIKTHKANRTVWRGVQTHTCGWRPNALCQSVMQQSGQGASSAEACRAVTTWV